MFVVHGQIFFYHSARDYKYWSVLRKILIAFQKIHGGLDNCSAAAFYLDCSC